MKMIWVAARFVACLHLPFKQAKSACAQLEQCWLQTYERAEVAEPGRRRVQMSAHAAVGTVHLQLIIAILFRWLQ